MFDKNDEIAGYRKWLYDTWDLNTFVMVNGKGIAIPRSSFPDAKIAADLYNFLSELHVEP